MDKEEIEKLIKEEKKTMKDFQKIVKDHKIPKEVAQKQIDFYLDTLNKLYDLQKKLNEE